MMDCGGYWGLCTVYVLEYKLLIHRVYVREIMDLSDVDVIRLGYVDWINIGQRLLTFFL
jgi:hypothetical protein